MSICGIYKIENIIDNKVYIGSSIDINRRWLEHTRDLNNNKHCNHFLQKAWLNYGVNSFNFSIIRECLECDLTEIETYYINNYGGISSKNTYNLIEPAYRNSTEILSELDTILLLRLYRDYPNVSKKIILELFDINYNNLNRILIFKDKINLDLENKISNDNIIAFNEIKQKHLLPLKDRYKRRILTNFTYFDAILLLKFKTEDIFLQIIFKDLNKGFGFLKMAANITGTPHKFIKDIFFSPAVYKGFRVNEQEFVEIVAECL